MSNQELSHPGMAIKLVLGEFDLSINQSAKVLGVSHARLSRIIKGARPITAEMAVRFEAVFGKTAMHWLELQMSYDLQRARAAVNPTIT